MNVRRAALLLLLADLLVGAFLAVGDHGSAQAAKTPATCSFLLNDAFANDSVPWVLGPDRSQQRPDRSYRQQDESNDEPRPPLDPRRCRYP